MSAVPPAARRPAVWAVAVALSAALPAPAAADNPGGRAGLFVPVPSPVTSETVGRVRKAVEDARGRGADRPAVVVFDFNPDDKPAANPDFGPSYTLARYLAGLHDLTTVAYVHGKATGHTALAVLACKELVAGGGAQLGEVVADRAKLPGVEAAAYDDLLGRPRAAQLAVARKMADPDVRLRKGQKNRADFYFDLRDRKAAEAAGVQVTNTDELPAAPDGRVGLFTADQLRTLGLANGRADSRQELADLYGLAPGSLKDDPLAGREPVAYRYVLRGGVDQGVREAVARMADKVIRERGNLLFLHIEGGGGDLQAARDLAADLRRYQEGDDRLTVVAYVPERAADTAAVVALGCSEIVMSKRADAGEGAPEAEFGDFEAVLGRKGEQADAWAASLKELADLHGYPPLLVEGMVRRDLEVVQVRSKADRGRTKLVTPDEVDKDNWVVVKTVKPKGQLLKLTATQAEELGLARFVTDTREPEAMYARYGVDPAKVRDATPAWLDKFASFLQTPGVTLLLIVIAFLGLILELKVPGTAVPGIVSALCFILVFWAHTRFSGQVAVLAGLLFLLGLVLLMMEVFVLPGFGVCGITGILLMLGSLALVTAASTDGRIPQTGDEWMGFGGRMATYMLALIGAVFGAFFLARYLPHIPGANRLMLAPPADDPATAEPVLPGAALAASLLGAVGTAVTVLRPAGSVSFGDRYVDVVADGSYIPAGVRVQVIEVEGTRIVVKEV